MHRQDLHLVAVHRLDSRRADKDAVVLVAGWNLVTSSCNKVVQWSSLNSNHFARRFPSELGPKHI